MLRTCLLSGVSRSPMRRFGSGVRRSGPTTLGGFAAAGVEWATPWYLDELFVTIRGGRQYLWRAVDQDGDVLDILVLSRRDRHAAARFFRKLLKRQGRGPLRLVTDKLRSYAAAHRTVMPSVLHGTRQCENNRVSASLS